MEKIEQQTTEELTSLKNLKGGLEILVQLAEKGDIDPWDVDIIDVTDKYLRALNSTPRENLLNAGRAIFFASVLLRLKSEILLNISNETLISSKQTENFFPEDELLFHDDGVHLDLTKLESFLVRSSLGKQQRKRKISLNDLIYALQQAEEEEEKRAQRAKLRQERAFTLVPTGVTDDILEIAHEEDVEEIAQRVELIIEEHLTDEKPITLSFLSGILNDKLKPFLALLFLANQQKIVLEQNTMYDEIYIYKPGTITEEEKKRQKEETKRDKELTKKEKKRNKILQKLRETLLKKKAEMEAVVSQEADPNCPVTGYLKIKEVEESIKRLTENG